MLVVISIRGGGCIMLIMKDFITDREFTVGSVLAFDRLQNSNIGGCIQAIVYPEGDNLAEVLPSGGVWVTETKQHVYSWSMDMLKKFGDLAELSVSSPDEEEDTENRVQRNLAIDNFETDFEISNIRFTAIVAEYMKAIRNHFNGYVKNTDSTIVGMTDKVKELIGGAEQKRVTIVRESGFSVNVTTFVINDEGAEILLPFIRRMLNYRYRVNNDDYVITINGWLFKSAKMSDVEFDLHVQRNCGSILQKAIDSPTDFIRSLV